MNCTEPVGLLPVTVAVKVTAWPNSDGLSDDTRVMLLVTGGGAVTTCTSMGEVLPGKLLSPLYTAVIGWLPTASPEVVNMTDGPDSVIGGPRLPSPSLN